MKDASDPQLLLELQLWRERHQILYQMFLDLTDNVEELKARLEVLSRSSDGGHHTRQQDYP
ncbi:hypothetical protein KUL97_01235 [Synechococcus sp. HK05]|uniref:hypothetical protein n=1 Tax=Synechococcus sp. HK05 TaxID=2725975 RepID=UPI001C380089|nr:hypothetical protein [Synechococcus sp. HK05]MBV2350325.1 hypothetical protein [Synechococcus sp. HK05]